MSWTANLIQSVRQGARMTGAAIRTARPIGAVPQRDIARVFNGGAAALLVLVIVLAFLDAPLAGLARRTDPQFDGLFRAFTDLAKADWMLVASGVAGMALVPATARLRGRARACAGAWMGVCAFIFLTVTGSGIAVNIVKVVFGRGRPRTFAEDGNFVLAPFTIDSSYASFPSGHATTAFAFAAALALFVPRLRVGLLALAALLAISRVVIGAHYLADVLAGALLGIGFTTLLAGAFHARGLVFAVRGGQLVAKAPRALVWPLRRSMKHRPRK